MYVHKGKEMRSSKKGLKIKLMRESPDCGGREEMEAWLEEEEREKIK